MPDSRFEALFRLPDWDHPPKRVVSLFPSMTASLFQLGFGESVVGVTDYCTRPADKLIDLARVGGTKTPDLEHIAILEPDLVIVNQEENTLETVEGLMEKGLQVWVTFPRTVQQSIDVLRSLLALYHTDRPALMINTLQMAVDYAAAAAETQIGVRYFCPIWVGVEQGLDWYMTFNSETYMHDLLRLFGGENIFGGRERRFPLSADLGLADPVEPDDKADRRYPRVTVEEVLEASPDLILVPDEPYSFSGEERDKIFRLLAVTPAVRNRNVHFVDGSLLTWEGVRLGAALQKLPEYFS